MDISPRSSNNEPDAPQNQTKQSEQPTAAPPPSPQPGPTPPSSQASTPESSPPADSQPFAMDSPQQQNQGGAAAPQSPPASPSPQQPAAPAQPASSTNFNVEEAMQAEAAPSAVPQATPPSSQVGSPQTGAPAQAAASASGNTPAPQATTGQPASPVSPQAPSATPTPPETAPAATSTPTPPGGKPNSKKRLSLTWIIGIITALIVLAGAFVFGYYLPNQPESVYRTGLERSGDVIKELTTELTQAEKIERFSQSAITAELNFTSSDVQASGVLDSRFDDARSDSTLDVSYGPDEATQQELNMQVMTDIADDAEFPDVFVNFSGIGQLGLESFFPGISQYDDQWIHISSTLIEESLSGVDAEVSPAEQELTAEDYAELMSVVTDVTNEYVFTSDESTAIFENQEYVAEEDINGVSTYKYSVDINRDNVVAYCQDIQERTLQTEVYRKLSGLDEAAIDSEIESLGEQCAVSVDDTLAEIGSVEMWVDRSYKLVHQIRFYANEEAGYVDIGQIYDGGDSVTFFIGSQVEEDEETMQIRLEATTNLESLTTNMEMTASQSGDNGFELVASLQAEPIEGDLELERPSNTIDYETFVEELFGSAFAEPEPQPVQSENFRGEVEFGQQPQQLSGDSFLDVFSELL